jgi:hypothetical protein
MSTSRDSVPTPRDASLEGWRSRLAAVATAYLLFQGVTGLWMYLAPFSIFAQLQVLAHACVGLALLPPFAVYQVRHFLVWWRQKPTAEQILGYALGLAAMSAAVTGVVLTWQAGFARRVGSAWDLVHLVSGIAAAALLAAHVLLVFARRRPAARRRPDLAAAVRRFGRRALGGAAAAGAVLVAGAVLYPPPPATFAPPEGYGLPAFAQQFDEYRDNPFAPTYARTANLELVPPELLAGSESCGISGCHEEILAEWQPSAHRFAAMNPPFQAIQRDFARDREPAETRYCAGCHDPISLFAGAKDLQNQDLSAPGMDEGISCAVCHSISKVDQRGNADYVITPPRRYLAEGTTGFTKWTSDFLIRAYPRQHLEDYDRNLLRAPEACGACHKQFIPEALNRFGLTEGQNQYDEWKKSPWNRRAEAARLACRDCHMRLVPDSTDPGRGEAGDRFRDGDDGSHRHHGFIATNLFMPELLDLPGWQRHVQLTEEWIRGETVLPEIADLWPAGPVAAIDVLAPPRAAPGEQVEVRVLVANRKAGHNFSTGPMDFIRTWIHLTVRDEAGAVIAEWGAVDPLSRRITDSAGVPHEIGNARDDGTLVLEAMPLDEHGELLRRHQLWKKAGGHGKRVIFPGYTDSQLYRFTVPATARGEITVDAELAYRRYRQELLDLVLPGIEEERGVFQPTVVQARTAKTLRVASGDAAEVAANGAAAVGAVGSVQSGG